MRALMLRKFGRPDVLVPVELADPVAGPGQVVVEIAFSNVTFVETEIRGARFQIRRCCPPVILGNGVGGVVAW